MLTISGFLFRFPVLALVLIVVGLAIISLAFYYSKRAKIKRALDAIPGKKIGQFVNGEYAKITGRISAVGETIQAPFSGRNCVYYYAVVEESSGKNSWQKIVDEEMMADVVISDGQHYAIIETDEPLTYLVPDREYTSQIFNDATPQLEQFLKRHAQSSIGFFGLNRTLRYREGVLEPNEYCTVAGYGEWRGNNGNYKNIPAARVLVLKAGKEATVYLSDDPETITS